MFRRYFLPLLAVIACVLSASLLVSAQTGPVRGSITLKQADGTVVPGSEAQVDIFRTDLAGDYNLKANKKGEFVHAGLPFIGTYTVAVSMPGAEPYFLPNIRPGREDLKIELKAGSGTRLSRADIKAIMARGGAAPTTAKESSEDKAKREEIIKKNKEIEAANARNVNINEVVNRTFKAGNEALKLKNYDEALKQYQEGLVADPEQGLLYLQSAEALRLRGADRFNASRKLPEAEKTAGFDAAKQDFRQAWENAQKAVEFIQKEEVRTDAPGLAAQNLRKLSALFTRTESIRLFVTKVDPSKAEDGVAAYTEYIAVETDPVKKAKAERDMAKMLFDANAYDKARVAYEKILAQNPDDVDALQNEGLILYNLGFVKEAEGKKDEAKALYQEAANNLQHFVDKSPEGQNKTEAQEILRNMKEQQSVQAEKGSTPARRRRP